MPNLGEWKPGDIVLVEAAGFIGTVLQVGQAAGASPSVALASRWSHAAIYIGNGILVEATIGTGVQQCSLWKYCQDRALTVRRIDDPAIPATDIAKIAGCAVSNLGEPYSVLQAVLGKLGWSGAQAPHPDALYCSTFAALVITEATGFELASDPQWQPLFPSTLAVHGDLSVVSLEWKNI